MNRYCSNYVANDLTSKMVFIGGPRQAGKTTLSQVLAKNTFSQFRYFNWDNDDDRKAILAKEWSSEDQLVIFDEIHKYPKWKQWIKGVYDVKPDTQQYLVTGSARLDVYKKGGDSLLGRYHYWRLHPFTLDERPDGITPKEALRRLLTIGGFPEPFLLNDEREAKRWRRERFDRILREDIRDLEQIHSITLLDLFITALRARVGSGIALSNIASDLQISPKTAKSWLALASRMYLIFPVYTLTNNIPRAIQKPVKVYFYDNADVDDVGGARLENLVATHLLKRLQFKEDYFGERCSLHYIRDKEGREVDFVTVVDGKVEALIEVKSNDKTISSALKYYAKRLKPKHAVQIVGSLSRAFDHDGIHVMSPLDFFIDPPWVVSSS